jgi:hypothetical protein
MLADVRVSRREFIVLAGAAAAGLALPRSSSAAPAAGFATQPRWQVPPVRVNRAPDGVAPGYVVAAPFTLGSPPGAPAGGPVILDNAGEPVWYLPLPHVEAHNLRVQSYLGRPVLTWYEGTPGGSYGGSCVIYDFAYKELKRVRGGHGLSCDLHEFLLTPKGTALLAIAATVPSPGGGPPIVEGVVQEREVESGKVLFEWHSLDHVPVAESYRADVTPAGNVDYFHLNSIEPDTDGNYLVSGRHTSTVYKLDRRSGEVIWRLGGKASDFTLGDGAAFSFQHDARRQRDGTITLFDNGATGPGAEQVEPNSRPIRLNVDPARKTATLAREYVPDLPRSSDAMGNLQVLPDGGVFVGWGTVGGWTEFAPDGSVRYDASFADGRASYRVFRFPWRGVPDSLPTIVLERTAAGGLTAHVSWNGSTQVASWRLLGGKAPRTLTRLAQVPRAGFETSLNVPSTPAHVAVAALNTRGKELARTATVAVH